MVLKTPAVEFRGVCKWFGAHQVLADIDLSIASGERVVICGPSGSGKSTMIRCVNQLEKHQRGEILINGYNAAGPATRIRELRQQVGMVFQQFNLYPHKTALENCTIAPILVRGMPKKDAGELAMKYLERVKIAGHASKYPHQLSGGQQQRVAIARALCMNTQTMLFDEPTSALDPEMIKEVLDVMIGLATDGLTMICVTHEMGFAREVADRVVFMDDGQILEIAPPSEFFTQQQNQRARDFLSRVIH